MTPSPSAANDPTPRRPARAPLVALLLLLLGAASLVPRLPILASAARDWSSDEAVDALVVQHLARGELTLFNWDATYYGIVEGVLGLPLNLVLGWTPLAFKLAAFAGFLLLLAGTYLLGRRLHGTAAGLAGAALLVGFSPALVSWSLLAAGGYCLVVAWGTLTLAYLARVERGATPALSAAFVLGLMAGFGLYIYELYLVYVALLALWAVSRSFAWHWLLWLLARGPAARPARAAALAAAPRQLRALALFAAGLAIGWAPKLARLVAGRQGAKQPAYALAGGEQIAANLRLLVHGCMPAFFGANLGLDPQLARLVAPYGRRFALAGAALLLAWGAVWLRGLLRERGRLAAVFSREPRPLAVEQLLPLFVPLVALAFVASRNPQNAASNRYLLPWLSALPVLAGAALSSLALSRRPLARSAGAGLALLLIGLPLVQIARWEVYHGRLEAGRGGLRIVRAREPLLDVIAFLRRQGIAAAYAPYWTCYKATMLAGERPIVAPLMDWDRYPPYVRAADRAGRVAYLFPAVETAFNPEPWREAERIRRAFDGRLASAGESARTTIVGPYAVVRGAGDRHLLPPSRVSPAPLASLRAAIAFGAPPGGRGFPAAAAPGAPLALPVRLTNASGAPWSADGLPRRAGELRVAAACRWLDAAGHALADEPQRSLLPRDLGPGETEAMTVRTTAPRRPGAYRLYVTAVQEGVGWFDQATGSATPPVPVAVR